MNTSKKIISASCIALLLLSNANAKTNTQVCKGKIYSVADRVIGHTNPDGSSKDTGGRLFSGHEYSYDDKKGDWYLIDGSWYWGGYNYVSTKKPSAKEINDHKTGKTEFRGTKVSVDSKLNTKLKKYKPFDTHQYGYHIVHRKNESCVWVEVKSGKWESRSAKQYKNFLDRNR